MSRKTFVLGLDGVPWDLIRDWTGEGELPNFARLLDEGTAGALASTNPATTPVAWPTITTGVDPDVHGLYGFTELTPEYSRNIHTGADVDQPRLWDYLSPAAVGNVPMTYPVGEIDGRIVSGMIAPDTNDRFAHPASLADRIDREIPGYEIDLEWSDYHGKPDELLADLTDLLEARRQLMEMLLEDDWEFGFFVFTEIDRLQHLVWDEDVLLDYYGRIDEILGGVLDRMERADADLFVVSDHGFGPLTTFVNVNTYLAEQGFLTPRDTSGTRSLLDGIGIDRDAVLGLLERVDIDQKRLVSLLPRSFVDSVAARLPGDHELYDVDYPNTVAFLDPPGSVYVNDSERFEHGTVSPERRPAVRAELVESLSALTDPETGEQVLTVTDGTELYPRDDRAPDVLVEGRSSKYKVKANLGEGVFTDPDVYNADHRPEGIFLAWGPDIAAGADLDDAGVADVAPTVMHAAGRPVPDHMDGRVLTEVFDPDSEPGRTDVETAAYDGADIPAASSGSGSGADDDDEDMDGVEDRLKGLGYME